jgi:hypothetical protein
VNADEVVVRHHIVFVRNWIASPRQIVSFVTGLLRRRACLAMTSKPPHLLSSRGA